MQTPNLLFKFTPEGVLIKPFSKAGIQPLKGSMELACKRTGLFVSSEFEAHTRARNIEFHLIFNELEKSSTSF